MSQLLAGTRTSQLITHLRERIVQGDYAPGSQLLQDSIAAEFGVSKIPVREALVQLQSEGLVDVFAFRGFQVRPVSAVELKEVFELRLKIEPLAVAEGAKRALAEDKAAALTAMDEINGAFAAGQIGNSGALNRAFHLALIVPRLQPVTADVIGRLHILAQRYIHLHLSPEGRVKRAIRDHTILYRTWAAREWKQASDLTKAHIQRTRDDLIRAVKT